MIAATSIKDALASSSARDAIFVQGWVRTRRDSKDFSFIELNDGSCLRNLQVIARNTLPNYAAVQHLITGASIAVRGKLVASQGKGQSWEVVADEIEIVGASDDSYPLQKKGHTPEFLREIAHLRPRSNLFGSVFRVRSRLAFAIHQFFQERGFVYVHTPIITGSDCEGAGELFRVTGIDANNPPRVANGAIDYAKDFFARSTYLTVSGQLEAEAFACALSKVYTFGPTFRAENSNTSRHANEFWMIEPEMAFCDLNGDMDRAEEIVKYLIRDVRANCADELELFSKFVDKELLARLDFVLERPFQRISYAEAVDLLVASGEKWEFPVAYGANLQSEHERWLTEKHFKCPVTVFNYPKEIKPFYMRLNDDGKTVTAMDVLVPGIGEIVGGSQREERFEVLEENMRRHKMDPADYKWYLDLRRYGAARRLRPGLRTHAHVCDRRLEHPRRHSLRAYSRQRGILKATRAQTRHAPTDCHPERSEGPHLIASDLLSWLAGANSVSEIPRSARDDKRAVFDESTVSARFLLLLRRFARAIIFCGRFERFLEADHVFPGAKVVERLGFAFELFLGIIRGLDRETDATLDFVHLDDARFDFLADLEHVLHLRDVIFAQL
jgi:asparaginyl-tRNA synthetase